MTSSFTFQHLGAFRMGNFHALSQKQHTEAHTTSARTRIHTITISSIHYENDSESLLTLLHYLPPSLAEPQYCEKVDMPYPKTFWFVVYVWCFFKWPP